MRPQDVARVKRRVLDTVAGEIVAVPSSRLPDEQRAQHWSVGATTGTHIEGAILNVTRHLIHPRTGEYTMIRGDHDGRQFSTRDEARAFAIEHGYTRPYYRRTWCPECRVLHAFMGRPSARCSDAEEPFPNYRTHTLEIEERNRAQLATTFGLGTVSPD